MSKELEKVISKLSQKPKEEKKLKEEEVEENPVEEAEEVTEETTPQPTKKASTHLEELEQQVVRLRDDGIYRVELLYQLQQINTFLKKLVGDDGNEEAG